MQMALVIKIEKGVDRLASLLFAAGCGYAAYVWFSARIAQPVLGVETAGVAAFAYLCCIHTLATLTPPRLPHSIPMFDLRQYDPAEFDELLLTERFHPDPEASTEPLVLDDVLAEVEPGSRVVRLFHPAAMPTPSELKSRIDRHLARGPLQSDTQEATQALRDALSELRRSIR